MFQGIINNIKIYLYRDMKRGNTNTPNEIKGSKLGIEYYKAVIVVEDSFKGFIRLFLVVWSPDEDRVVKICLALNDLSTIIKGF